MYYLLGNIVLLVLFMFLLYLRPDLRRQALIPAFVFLPLGPVSELMFFRDYWSYETSLPTLKIFGQDVFGEDLLFSFIAVGLISICYDFSLYKKPVNKVRTAYPFFATVLTLLQTTVFILLSLNTDINSIFAAALAAIIFSIPIIALRIDLIWCALGSSIISGIGTFLFYFSILLLPGAADYLYKVSKLSPHLSTLFFWGIPIPLTEIIWATSIAFFFSIIYKFAVGSSYS